MSRTRTRTTSRTSSSRCCCYCCYRCWKTWQSRTRSSSIPSRKSWMTISRNSSRTPSPAFAKATTDRCLKSFRRQISVRTRGMASRGPGRGNERFSLATRRGPGVRVGVVKTSTGAKRSRLCTRLRQRDAFFYYLFACLFHIMFWADSIDESD